MGKTFSCVCQFPPPPCCDQWTQEPLTGLEDGLLLELERARAAIAEREYYERHGLRCPLRCSSADPRPATAAPAPPAPPPARSSASDEALERRAVLWCRARRQEDKCAEETCAGDAFPSRREELAEALAGGPALGPWRRRPPRRPAPHRPAPRRPAPRATDAERRRFWSKYFPAPPLAGTSAGAPPPHAAARALHDALAAPCACAPPRLPPPPCDRVADLLHCPALAAHDFPTWTLGPAAPQPDMRCPRLALAPAPAPSARCQPPLQPFAPAPSPASTVQLKHVEIQPPTPAGYGYPATHGGTYYSGHVYVTDGTAQYRYALGPDQQVTHAAWTTSVAPRRRPFLEALHVGPAAPVNLSVVLYSNNVIMAQVKGFSPQAHIHVKSAISKRWTLPPEVPADSLACFLGDETLVIVTLPPPEQFYQLLHVPTAQCLGPPQRLAYPYPHL